jgi:hypothetical protein
MFKDDSHLISSHHKREITRENRQSPCGAGECPGAARDGVEPMKTEWRHSAVKTATEAQGELDVELM